MPTYIFYIRKPDQVVSPFEVHHLPDDRDAQALASVVLHNHADADHIDVKDGERLVAKRLRDPGRCEGP